MQAVNLLDEPRCKDITAQIESCMNTLTQDSGPVHPILSYLVSTGGKRLRPLLLIWTAEASAEDSGASPDESDVLEVASAFELVHLASLVHDDIIDGATERRGLPAAHTVWGIHSAVLAGDYLFTRANRVVLQHAGRGIASLLNQAIELTCEGEIAQDSRLFDLDVTEREYLSHICKKTASLVGAACQAGAILGGAAAEVEEAMLRFGVELGCAFQIADDVIDLISPSPVSGKPPYNDIRRGVLTLPLILAKESSAKETLSKVFAEKSVSDEEVLSIKRACIEEGCVDRARQSAELLAKLAESRLSCLKPSESKALLVSAARSVAHRLS